LTGSSSAGMAQVEGGDPATDHLLRGVIRLFEDGGLQFRVHDDFPSVVDFGFCCLKIARNGGKDNQARPGRHCEEGATRRSNLTSNQHRKKCVWVREL